MADTLLTMTGGSARVANLRDGLFGASGAYRASAFGSVATADATTDDWAVRYLSWMALGGTSKLIPTPILGVVANTLVAGTKRANVAPPTDANMLEQARTLCKYILPAPYPLGINSQLPFDPSTASFNYASTRLRNVPLIGTNGDAEMWKKLCMSGNASPIRALYYTEDNMDDKPTGRAGLGSGLIIRREAYPAGFPVGNHLGKIQDQLEPDNEFPWCWMPGGDLAAAEKYATDHAIDGKPLPRCPANFGGDSTLLLSEQQLRAWYLRGAANAGMSVYVYLDGLTRLGNKPPPNYNDCPVP